MNKSGGKSERLSKLQKYILMTAFKKTVQGERPMIVPWAFRQGIVVCNNWYDRYLVTADILLNYYRLKEKEPAYHDCSLKTKYCDKIEANKARIATRRAITILWQRNYVTISNRYNMIIGEEKYVGYDGAEYEHCYYYDTPDAVQLTVKGIEKAKELLKVC